MDERPTPARKDASEGAPKQPVAELAVTGPEEIEAKLRPVLEMIPEPHRQRAEAVVHEVSMAVFQGPMPPPTMLRGYEEITPGAADRIIAMAEREQAHRHVWETHALRIDGRYALFSLAAGWSIAAGLAVAAAAVGIWGDWRVGVALAATSATGMVWKLVQGRSETDTRKTTATPPASSSRKTQSPRGKRR